MSYALQFSGGRGLLDKQSQTHDFSTNDFTIQCWVKTGESGPIFTEDSSSLVLEILKDGAIYFATESDESIFAIKTEQTSLNDDTWHHLTAIKEGTNLSLLLSGALLPSERVTPEVLPNNKPQKGLHISSLSFYGDISQISIWSTALDLNMARQYFIKPIKGKEKGLLSFYPFGAKQVQESAKLLGANDQIADSVKPLLAKIVLQNDSQETLIKSSDDGDKEFTDKFPDEIAVGAVESIELSNENDAWSAISCSVTYSNADGSVEVIVLKSQDQYDSSVTSIATNDLISQVTTNLNDAELLDAGVVIAENLVVVDMKNVANFLNAVTPHIDQERIEVDGGTVPNMIQYNKAAQIFNRRFDLKPFVIVYCKSSDEVKLIHDQAIANNLPIRVRSGGHDHEGECSGNDTILIDLTKMVNVEVVKGKKKNSETYAYIGPGIRFRDLTSLLADEGVMIPHGTCATVGIAGFTMGGGWGPWTRIAGMCCEHLMGATMILGNGEKITLDATNGKKVPELLWALRGGGGMSYGIVTELVIRTFPLPDELIKFELPWNSPNSDKPKTPTLKILKAWEVVIKSTKTTALIGTNLKISAIPWPHKNYKTFNENTIIHGCVMYGYWNGNEEDLKSFVKLHFKNAEPDDIKIDGIGGLTADEAEESKVGGTRKVRNYGMNLMSSWDRESFYNVKRLTKGLDAKPLPPDLDEPAPHKITSRFVDARGLRRRGHRALLKSLTSPLLSEDNQDQGLFTYITLGAIVGPFYDKMSKADKEKSAFPYKDKLYTIQYQTWWNEKLPAKELGQNNEVYINTNRALDWMQVCRDFKIPNTSGSFISFKDSSIPTRTYFDKSYDKLKDIKIRCSMDDFNHFRTRKTII